VWSKALKATEFVEGRWKGAVARVSLFRQGRTAAISMKTVGSGLERQEGNGAGNGERLHEGSKALKGEPQERIRHEIRPAGSGRTQKRHEVEKTWRRRPIGRGKLNHRVPLP
jgi:hypothetical protein